MTIQVDSREKPAAIKTILKQFEAAGVTHFRSKLPVGDYISMDNARLSIDRKQNLTELTSNVCQQHERFRAELMRANSIGVKLIILVEHGQGIKTLDDVRGWDNPRLKISPYALDGPNLHKRLLTISLKYGVDFLFCDKRSTGKRIIELLGGAQ